MHHQRRLDEQPPAPASSCSWAPCITGQASPMALKFYHHVHNSIMINFYACYEVWFEVKMNDWLRSSGWLEFFSFNLSSFGGVRPWNQWCWIRREEGFKNKWVALGSKYIRRHFIEFSLIDFSFYTSIRCKKWEYNWRGWRGEEKETSFVVEVARGERNQWWNDQLL